MKIYFDACALNRLTDDQHQERIRTEADAVVEILAAVHSGRVEWIASDVLFAELSRNPHQGRREHMLSLLCYAQSVAGVSKLTRSRAQWLVSTGYGSFDAFHLACAESVSASVLLTTDDRFIRLAERNAGEPQISVMNPIQWLERLRPWLRRTK